VHHGNDHKRNRSVPHPNHCLDRASPARLRLRSPQGEGTAGGQFSTIRPRGDANSASRRTSNRSLNPMTHEQPKPGRALLPLPRGEGWGEGQTSTLPPLASRKSDAERVSSKGEPNSQSGRDYRTPRRFANFVRELRNENKGNEGESASVAGGAQLLPRNRLHKPGVARGALTHGRIFDGITPLYEELSPEPAF
jgi:hypothetical protein